MSFSLLIETLIVGLVLTSLRISALNNPAEMINFYKGQALLLVLITIITAFEYRELVVGFLAFLPLLFFFIIESLLAQATVQDQITLWTRVKNSFWGASEAIEEAHTKWLTAHYGPSSHIIVFFSLVFVAIAYLFSFGLIKEPNGLAGSLSLLFGLIKEPNGLAGSLSLLMVGLIIMVFKKDIISQIIGLLVMEHGMFLAAIRVLPKSSFSPSISILFVVSLMFYLGITLMMLLMLLPEIHKQSDSLKIEDQKILSDANSEEGNIGDA
jgi:hydrogenase-4 membrane subunit HyfE